MKNSYLLIFELATLLSKFFIILLLLRIGGRLLGLTTITPIFGLIYEITNWLTLPFASLLKNPVINNIVFDVIALFSLIFYGVIVYVSSLLVHRIKDENTSLSSVIEGEIIKDIVVRV